MWSAKSQTGTSPAERAIRADVVLFDKFTHLAGARLVNGVEEAAQQRRAMLRCHDEPPVGRSDDEPYAGVAADSVTAITESGLGAIRVQGGSAPDVCLPADK